MNTSDPRWTTPQLAWLTAWLVTTFVTVLIYRDKVFGNALSVCSVENLRDFFFAFAAPKNWLGLFFIAFTLYAIKRAFIHITDQFPYVGHIYRLLTVGLTIVILTSIAVGCS